MSEQYFLTSVLTIVSSVAASSSFWMFIQNRANKNDARTKMLIGLGHDRIMSQALMYIERGEITRDEYEDLNQYLYNPYVELGGNGTAKRIMDEVNKLPIVNKTRGDVNNVA